MKPGDRVKVKANELGPDFIGREGVITKVHTETLVTVKIDGHFTTTMFTKAELEVIGENKQNLIDDPIKPGQGQIKMF